MDVDTFYDSILSTIIIPEGYSAPIGAPISLLSESEDKIPLAKAHAQSQSQPSPISHPSYPAFFAPSAPYVAPAVTEGARKIMVTPFAKKLAKQHKVEIGTVVGTGPYGRITPTDVESKAGIQIKMPSPTPIIALATPTSAATLLLILGSTIVPAERHSF